MGGESIAANFHGMSGKIKRITFSPQRLIRHGDLILQTDCRIQPFETCHTEIIVFAAIVQDIAGNVNRQRDMKFAAMVRLECNRTLNDFRIILPDLQTEPEDSRLLLFDLHIVMKHIPLKINTILSKKTEFTLFRKTAVDNLECFFSTPNHNLKNQIFPGLRLQFNTVACTDLSRGNRLRQTLFPVKWMFSADTEKGNFRQGIQNIFRSRLFQLQIFAIKTNKLISGSGFYLTFINQICIFLCHSTPCNYTLKFRVFPFFKGYRQHLILIRQFATERDFSCCRNI